MGLPLLYGNNGSLDPGTYILLTNHPSCRSDVDEVDEFLFGIEPIDKTTPARMSQEFCKWLANWFLGHPSGGLHFHPPPSQKPQRFLWSRVDNSDSKVVFASKLSRSFLRVFWTTFYIRCYNPCLLMMAETLHQLIGIYPQKNARFYIFLVLALLAKYFANRKSNL